MIKRKTDVNRHDEPVRSYTPSDTKSSGYSSRYPRWSEWDDDDETDDLISYRAKRANGGLSDEAIGKIFDMVGRRQESSTAVVDEQTEKQATFEGEFREVTEEKDEKDGLTESERVWRSLKMNDVFGTDMSDTPYVGDDPKIDDHVRDIFLSVMDSYPMLLQDDDDTTIGDVTDTIDESIEEIIFELGEEDALDLVRDYLRCKVWEQM